MIRTYPEIAELPEGNTILRKEEQRNCLCCYTADSTTTATLVFHVSATLSAKCSASNPTSC